MNYSLFYKMIKEAQDSPGVNPTPAAPPDPPKVESPAPSPSESPQAVQPSNANAPAGPTRETLTADQLAGKWITDKQNFYRGKTDKYPQYANWTMSASNQNKLREQAQKMLDADRNAAWDAYKNQNDYSGSDGFRFTTTQRYESLPSVQARRQAEEAQKAQQAPMQNPTAPAAIGNPVPATVPLSTASSYEAPDPRDAAYAATPAKDLSSAVNAMQDFFTKNGYNPNPLSPGYKAFVKYMGNVLRELYPNMPPDQTVYAFMDYLRGSGSDEAKSVLPFMDSAVVHYSWPGGIPQRLGMQFPVYPSAQGAYYTQPVNK